MDPQARRSHVGSLHRRVDKLTSCMLDTLQLLQYFEHLDKSHRTSDARIREGFALSGPSPLFPPHHRSWCPEPSNEDPACAWTEPLLHRARDNRAASELPHVEGLQPVRLSRMAQTSELHSPLGLRGASFLQFSIEAYLKVTGAGEPKPRQTGERVTS